MNTLSRRTFIAQASATVAMVAGDKAGGADANVVRSEPQAIIDCNVAIGRWLFRELRPAALIGKLQANNVAKAWVGSFEALFQRDLAQVNALLAEKCTEFPVLRAVGSVHPKLPSWRDDLKRCAEEHGMKAIRLHPNYHGYALDDPDFGELLEQATERKMLIQIVAQMEDERTQHPLMQVKPVDLKPLRAALEKVPEARVMVLNANRAMSMTALRGCPVWIDIAMLEGVGGIENLLTDWPLERLVFGSHAPLFYWEAAKLKLQESELSQEQMRAICSANAQGLMA